MARRRQADGSMKTSQAWKVDERDVGRILGLTRRPSTGKRDADFYDDGVIFVEHKRKEQGIPSWLAEAIEQVNRAPAGRLPLIIVTAAQPAPAPRLRVALLSLTHLAVILKHARPFLPKGEAADLDAVLLQDLPAELT